MRVLLINPRYRKSRYRPVLQTGIGYLAEALFANGIEYRYLDMGFADERRELSTVLKRFDPDLIGISMLSFRYKDHYELARYINKIAPHRLIAAGGPHSSLFGRKILEECSNIDVVFKGEGERPLVDLCKGKDPSEIKGLIFRSGGKIKDTGIADFIYDVDAISFPRYRGFPLDRYIEKDFNILTIISSRGCPYNCSYCPVHQSMGHRFRMRSASNVVGEIEYWYAKGYRRFGISDDNFTFDRNRVIEICDCVKKRDLKGLKLSCDNGIRADRVDRELLELMRSAGFWRIAYGVEAGTDKILSGISKGLNIATVKRAIETACDLDYAVRLFFLIGSPNETWDDFLSSIALAKAYPVFETSFYNVIPYPGTGLFSWIEENGSFLDKPEDYLHYASGRINMPVFSTSQFSYKDRRRAFAYARGVSLEITRKALVKRLKPLGLLGAFAANLYGTWIVDWLLAWRFSRRLIVRFARGMIVEVLEGASNLAKTEKFQEVKEYYSISSTPHVSVIIPSLDGYRGGNVARLVDDFERQTYRDFEIHIIKNVFPQGKAINLGVAKAKGDILMIVDDDSRLGAINVLENLVHVLDENKSIGMAGVSILVPPDANLLQRMAGREFPRFGMRVVDTLTESDMACHGCCAIPKKVFEEAGRERENIVRGLDPDLRFRLRQKGYKTVIAANTWVYHPLPGTLGGLVKTFFRNGMGSAYCLKYQPELIYDTDERLEMKSFNPRVPFMFRMMRFPARLIMSLVTFKFLRFLAYCVYAVGFSCGMVKYTLTLYPSPPKGERAG